MRNIQKVIEQLGYKRKEAELYLAAFVLGESKVADLAEKLKIPRTSATIIVEKLHSDGLLNYYIKRFNKFWVAENPEKLLLKLKNNAEKLQEVLPEFKQLQPKSIYTKPTSKMYVGKEEMKFIFQDILLTKQNLRGVVAWNDLNKVFGRGYVTDFIETQSKHYLRFRLLTPSSEVTELLKERDGHENRETRFLSKHTASLNTATLIYGKKVAIISLNDVLPTGFLIEDADISNTMTVFFEELWDTRQ